MLVKLGSSSPSFGVIFFQILETTTQNLNEILGCSCLDGVFVESLLSLVHRSVFFFCNLRIKNGPSKIVPRVFCFRSWCQVDPICLPSEKWSLLNISWLLKFHNILKSLGSQ